MTLPSSLSRRANLIPAGEGDDAESLHLLRDNKTKYTLGSAVSSLYHLKDTDNSDKGFFVFPDLSVRVEGEFRLKLDLYEIVESAALFLVDPD